MLKRAFFAAVSILLGTVLALGFGEVALRLAWSPPSLVSTPAFEPHPVYGVAPRPGIIGTRNTSEYTHTFSHTAQGFRGEAVVARERGGRQRILFLGDSFTYGMGARNDETFVSLVGSRLTGVEVLNAGVNGFGQRDELAVLDALGDELRPDLVVLVFFWNDLEDNMDGDRPVFGLDGAGHVARSDIAVAATFDPFEIKAAAAPTPVTPDSMLYYTRELLKEGMKGFRYRYLGISSRDIQNEAQLQEAWTATTDLFRLLKRRSEELGTKLLVVSMPDNNKVDPTAVIKNIDPINFDIESTLRSTMDAVGLPYFDLFEALRAAHDSGRGPLYYYADRHLTPEGNRVVADALASVIREHLPAESEGVTAQSPLR